MLSSLNKDIIIIILLLLLAASRKTFQIHALKMTV